MKPSLSSSITKAASKQTYYTFRYLVDRQRVPDAFRAYAYFRWIDDKIDQSTLDTSGQIAFIDRQKEIMDGCYRGQRPGNLTPQECMLADLIQGDREQNSGLQDYVRNMMAVIDFDAHRRGKFVSQFELNEYTRWLAIAVTEAMHYFIGNGWYAPQDETRYLAVSAAHITHMLRDTFDDVQAGYFNIPIEVLEANHIGPQDVHSEAYRAWVRSRVRLAREYFEAGRGYLARVQNPRCRLAGFAYIARFEWILNTIEKEGFYLRSEYSERKSIRAGLVINWLALSSIVKLRRAANPPAPSVSYPFSKPGKLIP